MFGEKCLKMYFIIINKLIILDIYFFKLIILDIYFLRIRVVKICEKV